jgi:hypothetical protein
MDTDITPLTIVVRDESCYAFTIVFYRALLLPCLSCLSFTCYVIILLHGPSQAIVQCVCVYLPYCCLWQQCCHSEFHRI